VQIYNQCCVTILIYCGSGTISGSDFRKVSVPVSVPALVPVPDPDNV
jgi:hypothetical protein